MWHHAPPNTHNSNVTYVFAGTAHQTRNANRELSPCVCSNIGMEVAATTQFKLHVAPHAGMVYVMSTVTDVLVWLLWLSIVRECRQSMHIIAPSPVAYSVLIPFVASAYTTQQTHSNGPGICHNQQQLTSTWPPLPSKVQTTLPRQWCPTVLAIVAAFFASRHNNYSCQGSLSMACCPPYHHIHMQRRGARHTTPCYCYVCDMHVSSGLPMVLDTTAFLLPVACPG